jgi:hypothetical protein
VPSVFSLWHLSSSSFLLRSFGTLETSQPQTDNLHVILTSLCKPYFYHVSLPHGASPHPIEGAPRNYFHLCLWYLQGGVWQPTKLWCQHCPARCERQVGPWAPDPDWSFCPPFI